MNTRERYLTILKKGRADGMVWAPNFDHWYNVNRTNGTLPEEFKEMGRNDIARATGAAIWSRVTVLKPQAPNVKVHVEEVPGKIIRTKYETPVGTVETLHQFAEDFTRALFLKEHMIKTVEDIKVVKFMVEDATYTLDTTQLEESEKAVGSDGITLVVLPYAMPYIQFGKTAAGWERGIYLWSDYPEEVEELIDAYAQKSEECTKLAVQTSALIFHSDDNMDELTTPPSLFKRYGVPYYNRIARILHDAGKIFEVHWCGRTQHLLPLVKDCAIDVVEAVSTKPMAELTIPEALDIVGDQVVLQGGIPSVMMCPQCASREEFRRYVKELLEKVPGGYRYVIGMGDNVPPDADFDRIRMVSEMLE